MNNKILTTITAKDVLNTEYPELEFAINEILPQGIFIIAGSPKVGKSWLLLDICTVVSEGNNFWNFNTTKGDVLYLALEDNYQRLQKRLEILGSEESDHLHLAVSSLGINDGLIEQVKTF